MRKQPTAREINAHLASRTTYCYVYDYRGDHLARITRARSARGVLQGRNLYTGKWMDIPADAQIALTYC